MSERGALRILRVATDLYPEILGGGALHAHELSISQADQGHEVTVLTSDHGDRSLPREEDRDGYTVRRYRELVRPFGNSVTPGMVRGLLGHGFDVVHAHSHLYFSTNLAGLVARFSDVPLVITNHGLISQTAPAWVQRAYLPTVARPTLNAADRVLCYTATDRDRLRARGVTTEIDIVPNGIDCELFRPLDDVDEVAQLLYVGRLNRVKGPDRVLEAFNRLCDEFPALRLKLVGDGPLEPTLTRSIERAGLATRVTLIGRVANETLPELYNESSVFVLPSTNEGLPRTVLESLACETPVVTSDLPQLQAVVDGAGVMVGAHAIDDLAEALGDLLRDSARRAALGATGRQRVRDGFSWDETVRRTTEITHDVLAS